MLLSTGWMTSASTRALPKPNMCVPLPVSGLIRVELTQSRLLMLALKSRLGRFEASRPYFVLLRDTYDVKSRKDRLTFVHDPWHGLSIDVEMAVCKRAFRERRFDIQFGYGDDDELTFDCKTIKVRRQFAVECRLEAEADQLGPISIRSCPGSN